MAKLQLSSPWVEYYHKTQAMFKYDPDVRVIFDEATNLLKLYVEDPYKAAALKDLMPGEVEFGNVVLKIEIIPANGITSEACEGANLFIEAFKNNPAFAYAEDICGVFPNPITFVVFKKEVVQYFNDNLFDAHGVCSCLYQDVAKDIFVARPGVYYCTDTIGSDDESVPVVRSSYGRYSYGRRTRSYGAGGGSI